MATWTPPNEPGPLRHARFWLETLKVSESDPESRSSILAALREVKRAERIVRPELSAQGKRFNTAMDVMVNSGRMADCTDAFWAFVDGKATEEDFRHAVGA